MNMKKGKSHVYLIIYVGNLALPMSLTDADSNRVVPALGVAGTIPRLGFDLHYYPEYENVRKRMHGVGVILFSCVLSGRGRHFLDDAVFDEDGSSIAIVNYGQRHDIVTEGPMEVMNLFLDPTRRPLPQLPGELQLVLPQIVTLHPTLSNRTNRVIHVNLRSPEKVRGLLFAMLDELTEAGAGYEESARNLLSSFLILCAREARRSGVIRAPADATLERIRAVLDVDYAERIRLAELAEAAGMSPTYLCRRFRAYTGRSVFEYLMDRRLEAAMMALRSTESKISTIALESGFTDLAFFNRTFRKRLGTTPGAYRAGGSPPETLTKRQDTHS